MCTFFFIFRNFFFLKHPKPLPGANGSSEYAGLPDDILGSGETLNDSAEVKGVCVRRRSGLASLYPAMPNT